MYFSYYTLVLVEPCVMVTLLKISPTANSIDWVARQRMEQEDSGHADEHIIC